MDIMAFFNHPLVQLLILFYTWYNFYQLGRRSVMNDFIKYVKQEKGLEEDEEILEEMYIEKIQQQFYLYDSEDTFIAQGKTITDLIERLDIDAGQYKISTDNLTEDERLELFNSLKLKYEADNG